MPRTRALVLLAALLLACKHEAPAVRGAAGPRERTVAGLRIVEVLTQGADETSPLVVWLHGRGGRPERFTGFWGDFPGKVDFVLPQGPLPFAGGWGWFDYQGEHGADELATAIAAAEARLWPAIVAVAHGRKIIVGGFSQGGILAYALAARHPDEIAYALPVSGGLPGSLLPHGRAAPIYALHGADDDVVPIGFARTTVAAFVKAGATAELRELPGVGHKITDEMRADLVAHLRPLVGAAL